MKIKNVDLNTIRLTAVGISWQLKHAKAEGCEAVHFSFKEAGSKISFRVLVNQDPEEKNIENEPEDEIEDDTDE